MFYYLSFLRPPPTEALPSAPISITPQIANDLRTELYEEMQEIFYSWATHSASQTTIRQIPATTKPQKLTTWKHGSAYKELLVPPPPRVVEGQSFCLVLTTHAQGYPHVINLGSPDVGKRPHPVMSMPIVFNSKSANLKGKSSAHAVKQEHVERVYRIAIDATEQVFMRIKEQTSFDLDKKVWDSGIGLSSWIIELAGRPYDGVPTAVTTLKTSLLSSDRGNFIELGAGTGIVSLTLGALRSARSPNGGSILTTDLASAMPLLRHNISANASLFHSEVTRPRELVLDWDEPLPPEVSAVEGGFDVIIMADVTYNTVAFPSLVRTVSDILRFRAEARKQDPTVKETMILLGYKERDPAERTLWGTMQEMGVTLEKVDERRGAGGDPVEIWIGTSS